MSIEHFCIQYLYNQYFASLTFHSILIMESYTISKYNDIDIRILNIQNRDYYNLIEYITFLFSIFVVDINMYNEHLIARKTKNASHSFRATMVLANYNLSFHNIASISIALTTI